MKTLILKKMTFAVPIVMGIAIGLSSCGSGGDKTADQNAASDADKQILGAGATFPYPLYSKMFSEYGKTSGIQTNYQSIGSGGGVKQIMNKTVDFGASDAFLSDAHPNK